MTTMSQHSRTVVYTDGACAGNPGPGGWAWAVPNGPFASGAEVMTTNQRMEIRAALEAVRALEGPVTVVSDSTYVVNCFRDRWWEGWLRKGWVNSQRKPVANRDLWEPLIDLYRADPSRIQWQWVKGHSGDAMNDLVDRLAVEATAMQQGRSGGEPPDAASLGPADAPTLGTAADPRVPPGRRIVVSGHRPPELGGYEENPVAARVRRKLAEVLRAKREMYPDLVVLTGLGLGAEQLAAEAAEDAGVPYVAVLPYPAPESVWPAVSQENFRRLIDGAEGVVLLQAKQPDTKQAAGGALRRRDAWLARHADEAVVIWDGDDDLVGRLVHSLRDHVGEEEVWVIDPRQQ
jgi:ribonuclease HI